MVELGEKIIYFHEKPLLISFRKRQVGKFGK